MGTHSSDFRFITRKTYRITNPTPVPDPYQGGDSERDLTDGGGEGFVIFMLLLAILVVALW